MNAFPRLLRFGTVKKCASLVWKSALVHLARGQQWLKLRPQAAFWAVGISIVLLLIGFIIESGASWYGEHYAAIAPFLTLAAGVAVAWVALVRHFAQTDADRQRRITESFSKATEQLGSDKIEVRLGGIYSLERVSKGSPDDYWTVMENLTAFVRERSRRNEAERTSQDFEQRVSLRAYYLWREAGQPAGRTEDFWADAVKQDEIGELPATDIAAALTVINRRIDKSREREVTNGWCLDLSRATLKRADLFRAHLEGANLFRARLEGANLNNAHLEGASLNNAHLEGARLEGAYLEGVNLFRAHLESAHLNNAHLEGADLTGAVGLSEAQLCYAHGDDRTWVPPGTRHIAFG